MQPTASRQVVANATLFDAASGTLKPNNTLVIEGERIAAVSQEALQVDDATRIDAGVRSI